MPDEYEYSSRGIVAANIKRLMQKKGVIASDVCRALKIPNATFSDWMNGKTYPRIKQLDKLAEYFGVSKSDIVDIPIDRNDPLYKIAKEKTVRREFDDTQDPAQMSRDEALLEAFRELPPQVQEIVIAQTRGLLYSKRGQGSL